MLQFSVSQPPFAWCRCYFLKRNWNYITNRKHLVSVLQGFSRGFPVWISSSLCCDRIPCSGHIEREVYFGLKLQRVQSTLVGEVWPPDGSSTWWELAAHQVLAALGVWAGSRSIYGLQGPTQWPLPLPRYDLPTPKRFYTLPTLGTKSSNTWVQGETFPI